jgi:hypothetical protein
MAALHSCQEPYLPKLLVFTNMHVADQFAALTTIEVGRNSPNARPECKAMEKPLLGTLFQRANYATNLFILNTLAVTLLLSGLYRNSPNLSLLLTRLCK